MTATIADILVPVASRTSGSAQAEASTLDDASGEVFSKQFDAALNRVPSTGLPAELTPVSTLNSLLSTINSQDETAESGQPAQSKPNSDEQLENLYYAVILPTLPSSAEVSVPAALTFNATNDQSSDPQPLAEDLASVTATHALPVVLPVSARRNPLIETIRLSDQVEVGAEISIVATSSDDASAGGGCGGRHAGDAHISRTGD